MTMDDNGHLKQQPRKQTGVKDSEPLVERCTVGAAAANGFGGCVLACVAWRFLWDDDAHITKNTTLRTASGLWSIWTKPGIALHYYPLTFTSFWVGYHLWGLNPLGYHLLTLFFHGLTSVLLWQVLKRLQVRGAGLAGAIFALHPVNVMSVAWMTELKNTLSGTMALATAWAYVRFAGLGIYET